MTEERAIGMNEGWGFPGGSRKAHYFVGTVSLCRKWGFYHGPLTANQEGTSPDDCAGCRRALENRSVQSKSEER